MGTTAVATRRATLPANWEQQAKEDAAKGRQQVAKMGTSQRLKTQGGILMYMDTPVPGSAMDTVVLAAAPENSFYEGEFDPANTAPPICYAFGKHDTQIDSQGSGLSPHPESPKPQAKTCIECNWNKFGTAEKGRGKACKNSVHVMLFHADALKKKGGVGDAEVVSLSIPPTSGGGYKAWVKQMEDLTNMPKYWFTSNVSVTPRQQGGHFVNLNVVKQIADKKLRGEIFIRAKEAEKEIDARPPYPAEEGEAKPKGAAKKAARQAAPPPQRQQQGGAAAPKRRKF